jgi:hypothetical protein
MSNNLINNYIFKINFNLKLINLFYFLSTLKIKDEFYN